MKAPNTYVVDLTERRFTSSKGEDYQLLGWATHGTDLYFVRPYSKGRVRYIRHAWVFPARGYSVSRMVSPPDTPPFWCDWYIDIIRAERAGARWRVTDLYLDVGIHEGRAFSLKDVAEVGDALVERLITRADAAYILRTLRDITDELSANGYSGRALLGAYAGDLANLSGEPAFNPAG